MKKNLPQFWQKAVKHLRQSDPIMDELISRYHGEILHSKDDGFNTLARSITGQQISVKAADSVWKKIETSVIPLTPERILNTPEITLRMCGLSYQKVTYLRSIAEYFFHNGILIDKWKYEKDETIIAQLTSIKGVGRWTAEMYLIFHLLKPDVLPLDDIGLLKAIAQHYQPGFHCKEVPKHVYQDIAAKWQPYRSVATWYLWRTLDPFPVEY
jgi:DNA-3-methyladenine glycosylase II